MKELDNNQKARIADYLNGRPVELTDEELDMLSEDDSLASECLAIAQVSDEYDKAETKKEVRTFRLNTVWLSIAACLLIALLVTIFVENKTPEPVHGVVAEGVIDNGYKHVYGNVQTASNNNPDDFYTAAPDTPFEIDLGDETEENDDVVVCIPGKLDNPIFKTKVICVKDKKNKSKKIKKAKFEDGFAKGTYDCRVYRDGVELEKGAILIGKN